MIRAYGRMLFAAVIFGCGGKSATAPPPTYERSTLLIVNETGQAVDITLRCCGSSHLELPIVSAGRTCIILTNVAELEMSAVGLDGVYRQSVTLITVKSSPAWVWTLLPASTEVRSAATPCG